MVPASLLAVISGLTLGIGLIIGYAGRPVVTALLAPTATATAAATAGPTATSLAPAEATQRAGLMAYVLANTRLFRGNPKARVTMVEFGDFQ